MARNSNLKKNWLRYALQWGTLAAIILFLSGFVRLFFPKMEPADPEAFCPLGGLEALATYGVRGSLPCSMSSLQILMGITLAIGVVLLSKLFCAYLCPVGTVEDLLGMLRRRLGIKPVKIRRGFLGDKLLRIVKYLLVFWIFYMTATASELFCKHLDPYYAVATGFKGEITLWMALITVALVILGGFFADRFWCKYLCPLGAISNSLRFWAWILGISLVWWVLGKVGLAIPWVVLLGVLCLAGYLLEILCGNPKLQLLHVVKDDAKCTGCGLCNKVCPYQVDVAGSQKRVTCVDCTLCGECVGACNFGALQVGVCDKAKGPGWKYVPAILTLLLLGLGFWFGSRLELPTISETWNMDKVDASTLKTFEIMPLKSVKCFSSSMAFKGKVEQLEGTHGVKTYVGKHRVVITYDPAVTDPETLQEQIYVPSTFRVASPDPNQVKRLKIMTIRTEDMPDRQDLNNLGLQFRYSDKKIYGLESEFACPLIVRVFMDPDETIDEKWFKEKVEKKVVEMPLPNGKVREIPVSFRFVKMEKETGEIGIEEYLNRMFDGFKAEYNGKYDGQVRKRSEVYAGQPQFFFEIPDQNYEKPIILRNMPFLSNHLSREEGIIGTYLVLNKDLVPAIRIRYAAPCTEDRIWELMNMDTWTITYANDNVKEEPAKLSFDKRGISFPAE